MAVVHKTYAEFCLYIQPDVDNNHTGYNAQAYSHTLL